MYSKEKQERISKEFSRLEGKKWQVMYCIYLLFINLTEEDVETVISTVVI